jgi:hypothetical protein
MHGTPFSKIPDLFQKSRKITGPHFQKSEKLCRVPCHISSAMRIIGVELASLALRNDDGGAAANTTTRDIPKLVKYGKKLFHCKFA